MKYYETYQERRRSFGVGGAGNIRTVIEATVISDGSADGHRRRSSVWSTVSGTSTPKKTRMLDGMKNIFGSRSSKRDDDDFEKSE